MLWFGSKGRGNAMDSRVKSGEIPVLRRAEAQAEAGPLMLMMRRANMGLSIAASQENRKACGCLPRKAVISAGAGPGFR